jgi:hypothetical protein
MKARELNGSTGVVRSYDAAAARYEIELATTGKIIHAKAACVGAIESPQDISRDELLQRTGCRVPGVGKTSGCVPGNDWRTARMIFAAIAWPLNNKPHDDTYM